MKKYLSERKEDIQIFCGIGSDENGFKSKNCKLGLQFNKLFLLLKGFDCNLKGFNNCLNKGICLFNGTCDCSIGFDGNNCEICIY